jgi:hypothetical protein
MGNQQSNESPDDFLGQAKQARQTTERYQEFYDLFVKQGTDPCSYELNDEEAKCYLDRYPELKDYFGENLKAAKQHWSRFGCTPREARVFVCPKGKCLKPLTDDEARCYLNRYSDLQTIYGEDLDKAKADYKWFGCLPPENRSAKCENPADDYNFDSESSENIIKAYNKRRDPYKFNQTRLEISNNQIRDIEGDLESSELSLKSNRMEYLLLSLGGVGVIILSLKFLK